ncbi:MAG: hypothetical protein H0W76_04945 [Pyrinomonadaceae bacterium]|nr:hypothetical protein [Pyrinomonadaceae bacterium]
MSENLTRQLPDDTVQRILALLTSINSRLVSLEGKVDAIDTRLTTLEEKVDRRLQETRPIWEQLLSHVEDIKTELTRQGTRIDNIETELIRHGTRLDSIGMEMRAGFEVIEQKLNVMSEDVLSVHTKQKSLESSVWRWL